MLSMLFKLNFMLCGATLLHFWLSTPMKKNHVLYRVQINFRIFDGDAPVPKELTKGLAA